MQENAAGRWGLHDRQDQNGHTLPHHLDSHTAILHGQCISGPVSCVAALSDGQRVISGSFASKALQEWDLASGACSAKFEVSHRMISGKRGMQRRVILCLAFLCFPLQQLDYFHGFHSPRGCDKV